MSQQARRRHLLYSESISFDLEGLSQYSYIGKWPKIVLWIIGIFVGVPVLVVTFGAFMIFGFYPAQHAWNVHRMDAKNDRVWEEAVARVVTVEAELGIEAGIQTIRTDIACYEGYYARPLSLKSGAPTSGLAPKSVGFETLQAELPTGAILDINLRSLCYTVFHTDISSLPLKFRHDEANISCTRYFTILPLPFRA